MNKILVTPRSVTKDGHPALNRLRDAGFEVVFCTSGKQPSEDELITLLSDCVGYLAGVENINRKVLENARKLKVISRNGVGINNIDTEALKLLNIKICITEGANARGVAELTIGFLFSLTRSIPFIDACLKQGKWERRLGSEVFRKTLGIIGCGRIGKEVACMALSIGMHVLAYDPVNHDFFTPSENFRYASFNEVIMHSDFLSLHAPAGKDEKPLVDKDFIKKMKRGAYLINTARGELIDDNAVFEGLNNGTISGYGTDVFRVEPPEDKPLFRHDKVITTPHIGGYTDKSVNRAMEGAVDNLLKYLSIVR